MLEHFVFKTSALSCSVYSMYGIELKQSRASEFVVFSWRGAVKPWFETIPATVNYCPKIEVCLLSWDRWLWIRRMERLHICRMICASPWNGKDDTDVLKIYLRRESVALLPELGRNVWICERSGYMSNLLGFPRKRDWDCVIGCGCLCRKRSLVIWGSAWNNAGFKLC
jgi:hypothetical protein